MPITQGQMIEQMQEARALHTSLVQLREGLAAYCQSAKDRYPTNSDLQEVLTTILYTIKSAPIPDDRATYVNERHYSRRAKWNIKAQVEQERKRRLAGVPEKREAMAALRAQRDSNAIAYATPYPDSQPAQPSRPGIIFPRDDPNDKPLEFETLEDLPAPRDQNNLLGGLDLGFPPSDDDGTNNGET